MKTTEFELPHISQKMFKWVLEKIVFVSTGTFLLTLTRLLFVGWSAGKKVFEYTYAEQQIVLYLVVLAITAAIWSYDQCKTPTS